MMRFQTLLAAEGIDERSVALCLHKPLPEERGRLAMLAETRPEVFAAYQETHPPIQEATLKARKMMAVFFPKGAGELVFLGLWGQHGWTILGGAEFAADPRFQEMWKVRATRRTVEAWAARYDGRARFDLRPLEALSALRGRLVVTDPAQRNYMRLAETTPLGIVEITRSADLSPPMPGWRLLSLTADELSVIPARWADTLRHWRGIYLLTDEADGARYVGAAYGDENLLGRWRAHVAGEVGVTKALSLRNPAGFRFSILELLSPAAMIEEVTVVEQGWMHRLHSKRFGLNA